MANFSNIFIIAFQDNICEVTAEDSHICHETHANTTHYVRSFFFKHAYVVYIYIYMFEQMPRLLWNNEDGINPNTLFFLSKSIFQMLKHEIEFDNVYFGVQNITEHAHCQTLRT